MRLLITGYPGTGKTTMAKKADAGCLVCHTDSTIPLGWSESSAEVATWFAQPGPWIIEGVAIPRALRKWLADNETGAPRDRIMFLTHAYEPLTGRRIAMAKAIDTGLTEISDELRKRGVEILEPDQKGASTASSDRDP